MILATLVLAAAVPAATPQPTRVPGSQAIPQPIRKKVRVAAPPAEVWKALTTAEGIKTFLAPEAKVSAEPGGPYEIYFIPGAPEGLRGSEGCTVVSVRAGRQLVTTWNFPPSIPSLRQAGARTKVTWDLRGDHGGTRVRLTNDGYRAGPDWEKGRAYFDKAWDEVLRRLEQRFKTGPIDLATPPAKAPPPTVTPGS